MTTVISRGVTVTPLIVLSKIIELTGKSPVKTIRIDTLALIFGVRPADIVVLLKDLEAFGNVRCHIPLPGARRSNNIGMAELLDYEPQQQ